MQSYRLPVYGLRLVRERSVQCGQELEKAGNSREVAEMANRFLRDSPVEQFLVFFMDCQNRLIGMTVQKGTVNQTAVYPAEIYKAALLCNSVSIVLVCHNHPSGVLKPSPEDIRLTQKLKEGARLLGLALLDHIIVDGMGGFYSFLDAGIL